MARVLACARPDWRRQLGRALLSLIALLPAISSAELPMLNSSMQCLRSASILACTDPYSGSHYAMAQRGDHTYIRGYDAALGQTWAQTITRFGRFQFFSGISSNGTFWFGSNQLIGWTAITHLSTSAGDQSRFICSRMTGCN